MTIESLIAQIDEQLSQQMNNILHHKEFQKLESARQGLSYLVDNTNVSETLKIRVLNISRDELTRNLRRYRGSASIKARCSNKFMNKSMASSVASRSAASSAILSSITAR